MELPRQWWQKGVMRSHSVSRELLAARAAGTLPDSSREAVDAHVQTCTDCARTLQQLQRLQVVLRDLPPAPAVPFDRVWSKLEPALPRRLPQRVLAIAPRRLALAFALVVVASLSGIMAFASDATLPDSALYGVKLLREQAQLALVFDQRGREALEVRLAAERLHEAEIMVDREHVNLALQSLLDFRTLVGDAAPALQHPASADVRESAERSLAELRADLDRVEEANARHGQDPAISIAVDQGFQVLAVLEVEPADRPSAKPSASPAASASAAGTPRPDASPQPTVSPTAQPTASGSPQPSPSASETPKASPTASASATPSPSESASASPSPSR
jgi:hypothetical protein